jgi:hypothetical protein
VIALVCGAIIVLSQHWREVMTTYITGLGRANEGYGLLEETHLYEVKNINGKRDYLPLCKRGFNRDYGTGFSIFRGNSGDLGCCQVCNERARKGKPGLGAKLSRKLKKKIKKLLQRGRYTPLLPGLPLIPDPKYFGNVMDES